MGLTLRPEIHSAIELRSLVQGVLDENRLCTMSTVNQRRYRPREHCVLLYGFGMACVLYFEQQRKTQQEYRIATIGGGRCVRLKSRLGQLENGPSALWKMRGGSRSRRPLGSQTVQEEIFGVRKVAAWSRPNSWVRQCTPFFMFVPAIAQITP